MPSGGEGERVATIMIEMLIVLAFIALMLIAMWHDATRMIIPNWISLVLVAGFVLTRFILPMPFQTIALHVLCGSIFFAIGYLLFYFGLFGGGDVKLLAAVMLWLGFPATPAFLLLMSFFGALIAIVSAVRGFIRSDEKSVSDRFRSAMRGEIPYGIAIGLAAIVVVLGSAFPINPI